VGAFPETTITNLQGLEAFTNLERITLQTSNALWADYNLFPNLVYLKHNAKPFNTSLVTTLYVTGLSNLKYIIVGTGRNVSEFYNITSLTSLEELDISQNRLNSNTFNNLPPSLKKLKIQNNCNTCASGANSLEGIMDFSYLVNLVELDIAQNDVTGLILKDNLVVGDTFTNQASIYFDYNLPIVTNNESTIISALGIPDFTIDNAVAVYPNPAKNDVTINTASTIRTVQFFDVQGRVLETDLVGESQFNMDISKYSNGIYFLKVTTGKGIKTQRIIKE